MTMICSQCGKTGIHWVGPWSNLTGTKCPHCGGQNCHGVEEAEDCEPDDSEDLNETTRTFHG